MSLFSTISLLSNGLTLALSLGFLLIVLWNDVHKELSQFFAIFLLFVMVWNLGSLFALVFSLIGTSASVVRFAVAVMEIGFTGSNIAAYALTAILTGVHTRRFRLLIFLSLGLVLVYQILLIISAAPLPFAALGEGFFKYRFQPLAAIFFLLFDGIVLYLLWRYRRKVTSNGLFWGLNLFALSQGLGFLNPELGIASLSITLAGISTLVISFAMLRQEIIKPLAERVIQVEAVHKVSLAIASHLSLDRVLTQIAMQAVGWSNADAAAIFLNSNDILETVAVHNLPDDYLNLRVNLGDGIAGKVVTSKKSVYLENYERDWKAYDEFPDARKTFGSVISVPLIYNEEPIGVLVVIGGKQGRLLRKEDVQSLELLGAQAAVAITNSRLFAYQDSLTRQVEAARSQLETVLISTENPVVAVDRELRVIFANPAAQKLALDHNIPKASLIRDIFKPTVFPNYHNALRDLRYKGVHIYEVQFETRDYLCHIASLGKPRSVGWVAILNDVSQLKEIDRLKSEMIRMTSHDLKNPLQAATANLDLLTDDLADNPNQEVHLSLSAIHTQLGRMNRIIGGILDLERIKSGNLEMQLCFPHEIIEHVVEELQLQASAKEIEIKTDVARNMPSFAAEPEQFERVFVNLVENAIKFTGSGGVITIKAALLPSHILFSVADTGIGISPELQPFVFERFWRGGQRGQSGAEHVTGTGLGLSIVKAIVEHHGGEIWLISGLQQGTTFFVKVPIHNDV